MSIDYSWLDNITTKSNEEPQQRAIERKRDEYGLKQHNLKRSERYRAAILDGLKQGESTTNILLKAVDCIGEMTGDNVFVEQAGGMIKGTNAKAHKEPVSVKQITAKEIPTEQQIFTKAWEMLKCAAMSATFSDDDWQELINGLVKLGEVVGKGGGDITYNLAKNIVGAIYGYAQAKSKENAGK